MITTTRSKMTAAGTFFASAMLALMAVSAQPRQAVAFDGLPCPGSAQDGNVCATVETPVYCEDEDGNPYVCRVVTEYYYYDKPNNG